MNNDIVESDNYLEQACQTTGSRDPVKFYFIEKNIVF